MMAGQSYKRDNSHHPFPAYDSRASSFLAGNVRYIPESNIHPWFASYGDTGSSSWPLSEGISSRSQLLEEQFEDNQNLSPYPHFHTTDVPANHSVAEPHPHSAAWNFHEGNSIGSGADQFLVERHTVVGPYSHDAIANSNAVPPSHGLYASTFNHRTERYRSFAQTITPSYREHAQLPGYGYEATSSDNSVRFPAEVYSSRYAGSTYRGTWHADYLSDSARNTNGQSLSLAIAMDRSDSTEIQVDVRAPGYGNGATASDDSLRVPAEAYTSRYSEPTSRETWHADYLSDGDSNANERFPSHGTAMDGIDSIDYQHHIIGDYTFRYNNGLGVLYSPRDSLFSPSYSPGYGVSYSPFPGDTVSYNPFPGDTVSYNPCPGDTVSYSPPRDAVSYSPGDAYDQYGDMRVDVNNMSYDYERHTIGGYTFTYSTGFGVPYNPYSLPRYGIRSPSYSPLLPYTPSDADDWDGNMRLDELLDSGERIGPGLSEDVMSKSLVEFLFSASEQNQEEKTCRICLEVLKNMEKVGRLRKCGHEYHAVCIKKWLRRKNACPLCRSAASNL